MPTVSTHRVHNIGQAPPLCDAMRPAWPTLASFVDALLTRRATRVWWLTAGGLVLTALVLRASAWIAFPTIITADTDAYCAVAHAIQEGRTPDLSYRNVGYPLFMSACRLLPLTLNKSLPLVQHVLGLAAALVVMTWMRRNWGVLAGLMTGALLLINSGQAIWAQYAMPGAWTCSLMPLATIAMISYVTRGRRRYLVLAFALWLLIILTREELLALALVVPATVLLFSRGVRRACRPGARCNRRCTVQPWFAVVLLMVAIGFTLRSSTNLHSTGKFRYSTHAAAPFTWRVLHHRPLVAPPRPLCLERLYSAAETSEAARGWWRGQYLHWEGAQRVCRAEFGMSFVEAVSYMTDCALKCIQRRPGVYASVVLRDAFLLWARPNTAIEWLAFQQSDPAKFHADAAKLTWATHARAEFPDTYKPSAAQRLFRQMAILRPGETFAMKPLMACFLLGSICLLSGVGTGPGRIRRWWFAGLAAAVVALTLFYAGFVDPTGRYRMNLEWAFFAIASLGVVLPLRFLRRRRSNLKPHDVVEKT